MISWPGPGSQLYAASSHNNKRLGHAGNWPAAAFQPVTVAAEIITENDLIS